VAGLECSSSQIRFGGQVHWHPAGNAAIDPWVGLGSGYESLKINISGGGDSGSASFSGWEFVNIQVGVDFALSSAIKIGPWISFSLSQFSTVSAEGAGGGFSGGPIDAKSIHQYLMGGVRLVILP